MKHILSVRLVNGGTDTYMIITDDDQTEVDSMNFVSAVKDGEVFLARITRTYYSNQTYEFKTSENKIPVGYNMDNIISVIIESPEDHVSRITEGLY